MVPDRLFGPLDLDEILDEAYDTGGDEAVAATLAEALSDPRAAGDAHLALYLDEFTEASSQSGDQRHAITVLAALRGREEGLGGLLTGRLAEMHAELGEYETARGLLDERAEAERELPAGQRSLDFYVLAADVAGGELADPTLSAGWVAEGLRLLEARDPDEDGHEEARFLLTLVGQRYNPTTATETSAAADTPPPADGPAQRRRVPRRGAHRRPLYRIAYLPEAEFTTAAERGLLAPTVQPRHEDYRRELEAVLRARGEDPGADVLVMPLDVDGLMSYAEAEGKDPARRATRTDYTLALPAGRAIGWPPGRNTGCWCGSKRKYKKCCGHPAFTQATPPDPATTILRIDLDGTDPPVWRRLAVPSRTQIDALHHLIQAAMGWRNEHPYAVGTGETTLTDPRLADREDSTEGEELISLGAETGDEFSYLYDFGDGWSHTITVCDTHRADPDNQPRLLDGAGACPPEDVGGIVGYQALLTALIDPSHPNYDDAVELLGHDYDPTAYQPSVGQLPSTSAHP